ncbi:MAG: hypothetical protein HXY34_08765, partial [Candidatus Thorarchaeota archaeon]|nr:hypothetical protein [Candidatus Thorarchaeota archaeon]
MFDELEFCVAKGDSLGASFVEARYEDLSLRTLQRSDDVWKDLIVRLRTGFSITCYVDGVSGFSFTPSSKREDLLAATDRAVRMAKASASVATLK